MLNGREILGQVLAEASSKHFSRLQALKILHSKSPVDRLRVCDVCVCGYIKFLWKCLVEAWIAVYMF